MNIYKIILLIFLFSFSYEGMSQDKIIKLSKRKNGFKYQYQGYLYKEKQIAPLIKKLGSEDVSNLFRKAIANKNKALTFSALSIVGWIVVLSPPDKSKVDSPFFITPFVVAFSTPFFAIGEWRLYFKRRNKAILAFNTNREPPPKIGVTSMEMNLGFTTAGIGIRISF